MRIYAASSWRNAYQPGVVRALREAGHEVYDFRNPTVGYDNPNGLAHGFHWSAIDPEWQQWTTDEYAHALQHPLAEQGFASDKSAMQWAELCVLVLPCGRSAHAEAGWIAGTGRPVVVYVPENACEPELMYRLFGAVVATMPELLSTLSATERVGA